MLLRSCSELCLLEKAVSCQDVDGRAVEASLKIVLAWYPIFGYLCNTDKEDL